MRGPLRSRSILALAGSAVVALATTLPAEDSGATKVVDHLNGVLLGVLKDADSLGYRGRFDRLAPAMTEAFDLDFMAEKALGRHWKPLGEADRARWVAMFREFTAANYAANFDRYSGQRFELLGEEASTSDTTLVRTRVVNPGGENVDLSYRLHRVDDHWRIVDVYLKGTVSELALRRSDYTGMLERNGFDALLTTVRGKIGDLAAGRAKRPVP